MAPHLLRRIAFGATIALTIGRKASAQNPPSAHPATDQRYRYRLLGVYDDASGEPIPGVEVSDILNGTTSVTSATGTLSLFFLPDGGALVRLRKVGYEVQTLQIPISPADTAPLTITLKRAVTLPTVDVKDSAPVVHAPQLRSAVERMNSHRGGYFVDEKELRKQDHSVLSNVLIARMPGLTSIPGRHGEVYIRSSRVNCIRAFTSSCQPPDCFVSVYMDGVKVYDPVTMKGSEPFDFGRTSPMDFAIVEFYPGSSSTPAEFSTWNSPCGMLLLWTRER